MRSLLGLYTFIASFVALVAGGNLEVHHKPGFRRHAPARLARGLDPSTNSSSSNEVGVLDSRDLEKRFEGASFTFYDAGLGACGQTNSNSDFIVALNAPQYGSGGYCFQTITIIINGKTATAQITDECMGCGWGALDFSRGLFNYFASESAGVLTGSWYFGTQPATTTSTYIPPTSTLVPTPTTTTTSSSSSSVVSSTSVSSTSSAAVPSQSSTQNATTLPAGVLGQFNVAFVNIGAIILATANKLD